MNVGVIGCGNISDVYLQNCKRFDWLKVVACADLDAARAEAKVRLHGVVRACSVKELLANKTVELVLNITPPGGHFEIARKALEAGKHVYNEKPLSLSASQGKELLRLAARKKLRVGGAPDTFMGASLQSCRQILDSGAIGKPVAATAFMMCHGHESWHPNPGFFYEKGGGPLFDMGPYYLTALVHLLGPAVRVSGSAKMTFPQREITSQPLSGKRIRVKTPTHISGNIEFANGTVVTLIMSFDVWFHGLPCLEVYGSEGTLSVPDPNNFNGMVKFRRQGAQDWELARTAHGYAENSRGVGLADMAQAIAKKRPHRASGEMACHVLEIMETVLKSAKSRRTIDLKTTCDQPKALKEGLIFGRLD